MIKRAGIVFLVLFLVYTFIIISNPGCSASQQQWQENVIKGEKYIYNKSDTFRKVIVGSSLACRILTDSLKGVYNLAFAGQSIYDGLEILTRQRGMTDYVFIEMNKVFIEPNRNFTESLFSTLEYNVRKYCISLRSDKQPLAFLFPAMQSVVRGGNNASSVPVVPVFKGKDDIFETFMDLQLKEYANIPESSMVEKNFFLLREYVQKLNGIGVSVIFFEMPLNPRIVEMPLEKYIRTRFHDYFPRTEFRYIDIPEGNNFVTTDGIHLNEKEAIIYTEYFRRQIKDL